MAVFAAFFAVQNANAYSAIAAAGGAVGGNYIAAIFGQGNLSGENTQAQADAAALSTCELIRNSNGIPGTCVVVIRAVNSGLAGAFVRFNGGTDRGTIVLARLASVSDGTAAEAAIDAACALIPNADCSTLNGRRSFSDTTVCDNPNFVPLPETQCGPCPGDSTPNTARTACELTCTGNTFANTATSTCDVCQPGTIPNGGNTACMACTGATIPNPGQTACINCTAGMIPNPGNTQCTACDANQIATAGSENCTTCTGNMVPNDAQTQCVECAGALIPNTNNSACVSQCRDNEAPNAAGACVACPAGMVPNSDNTACMSCTGSEVPNEAGTECEVCTGDQRPDADNLMCVLSCTGNQIMSADETSCTACPADSENPRNTMVPNDDRTECTLCGDNEIRTTQDASCAVCPDGMSPNVDGNACLSACQGDTVRDKNSPNRADRDECRCPEGATLNTAPDAVSDSCVCANGKINVNGIGNCLCPVFTEAFGDGRAEFCEVPLPAPIAANYDAATCAQQNWTVMTLVSNGLAREICGIPFIIATPVISPPIVAASSGGIKPQQTNPGDSGIGCVLRQHPGFVGQNLPPCNELLPAGILERPTVIFTRLIIDRQANEIRTNQQAGVGVVGPLQTQTASSGGGGSGIGAGGIMVAALIGAFFLSGDGGLNPDAFAFTPQYTFSHNDGLAAYSYGSRIDYREKEVSAYWGVSRSHTGGATDKFLYSSGLGYEKEFWRAGFAGVSYEETTELDLWLSAKWQVSGWHLESGINADIVSDEFGEAAKGYWNAGATLEYQGWQITPSANIFYREGESFGDRANFRINLRREF